VGSSSVDSALNLLKGGLELAGISIKVYINLKEGLKNLLWSIPSPANSLFHLVQRVLCGVEECLIHGPVVILRELLNLLS
jgi:hypothetical protein